MHSPRGSRRFRGLKTKANSAPKTLSGDEFLLSVEVAADRMSAHGNNAGRHLRHWLRSLRSLNVVPRSPSDLWESADGSQAAAFVEGLLDAGVVVRSDVVRAGLAVAAVAFSAFSSSQADPVLRILRSIGRSNHPETEPGVGMLKKMRSAIYPGRFVPGTNETQYSPPWVAFESVFAALRAELLNSVFNASNVFSRHDVYLSLSAQGRRAVEPYDPYNPLVERARNEGDRSASVLCADAIRRVFPWDGVVADAAAMIVAPPTSEPSFNDFSGLRWRAAGLALASIPTMELRKILRSHLGASSENIEEIYNDGPDLIAFNAMMWANNRYGSPAPLLRAAWAESPDFRSSLVWYETSRPVPLQRG